MVELKDLVKRSTKATCGIMEREVLVKNKNINKAINTLRHGGFHVIGKSINGTERRKIWFIRRGGF